MKTTAGIGWVLCEAEASYCTLGGDASGLKAAILQRALVSDKK